MRIAAILRALTFALAGCSGTDLIEATCESGAVTGTAPAGAGGLVEWDPIDPVVTITLSTT